MSLDDIILSPELRSLLFKNGIINPAKPVQKKTAAIPFEGSNKKHILIAFDGTLRKEDRSLLDNLVSACKITMDDIALVNLREQEATMPEILSQLHIQKAIFFGIPALDINLPLEDAEEKVMVYDHCSFLKTAPLAALHQNIPQKKALWSALKIMFGI